jgi:S-adenosylmethionine:tRNA ribosyltransferase-isomerase
MPPMRIEEFDYDLPERLIARFPSPERGAARMLRVDGASGRISDQRFSDFPDYVETGDVVVVNDTRVVKARLIGVKPSGGRVEALIERVVGPRRALAMLRTSHVPRPGQRIIFGDSAAAMVVERKDEFLLLEFEDDVSAVMERVGEVPLPPYIDRRAEAADETRYQTVYAQKPGAVAAPTAGLHFDQAMLDRLGTAGVRIVPVTLHVGAGTFQPVRVDDVSMHVMHGERYEVPDATVKAIQQARQSGRRVVAIGTTSVRALESAARSGTLVAGEGETRLFIRPGYTFRVVDRLLTNFHLPRSTLLMLVSAFASIETIRRSYRHAIESGYRFFSYGDAMLIDRVQNGETR